MGDQVAVSEGAMNTAMNALELATAGVGEDLIAAEEIDQVEDTDDIPMDSICRCTLRGALPVATRAGMAKQ